MFSGVINPEVDASVAVMDFLPEGGAAPGPVSRCSLCGEFVRVLPSVPLVIVELASWVALWGDMAFGLLMDAEQTCSSVDDKMVCCAS